MILTFFGKHYNVLYRSRNPKVAHLTDEEMSKVEQAFRDAANWLDQARTKLARAPKHLPPPITIAQIRQEKYNFDNVVNPILSKPAPKEPEESKKQDQKAEPNAANPEQNQQQQEKMEWS